MIAEGGVVGCVNANGTTMKMDYCSSQSRTLDLCASLKIAEVHQLNHDGLKTRRKLSRFQTHLLVVLVWPIEADYIGFEISGGPRLLAASAACDVD